MNGHIKFRVNQASATQIAVHLRGCDTNFVSSLSRRINIDDYSKKIANKAMRFEAWSEDMLVGLVAMYCNDQETYGAYITSVSVLGNRQGKGIASFLIERCIEQARIEGIQQIDLEVKLGNVTALLLYRKFGFEQGKLEDQTVRMTLKLDAKKAMISMRDYNKEIKNTNDHKYAYNFDFDVMHPYMIKSFEPFFRKGSLLELGSFKGDFTKRLLGYFDDIACMEASDVALEEAKSKLGDKINFMHACFETANLAKRFDNIVLTHVLEHLDDPVLVLKRVNDEWLTETGRLFLVCPNANAPSRQIAVKMGLISHNAAVTPAEAEHGHRRTYTLDTLERDAVAAGLKPVYRSGIFFKALANFQWDRILNTDIISKEYLEGCYKLGQQYPDLCSSIFLLCERGEKS